MSRVPIGRFSKMTRLSIKALRLYDRNELLRPVFVDPSTGYRYYDLEQANRAEAIRALRSVDVPLEQIRAILDSDDPAFARAQLVAHRERLAARLASQERMLAYLETLIQRKGGVMPYEVSLVDSSPQRIAAVRKHTNVQQVGDAILSGFGALMRALTKEGVAAAGPPLIVYHHVIDQENDGDIEVCVPIEGALEEGAEVYVRELEGGKMATTVHRGPYEQIAPAYHTLTGWISGRGHEIGGPPREIYLNDPRAVKPEELLTRVEFPVCPEPDRIE